MNESKRKGFRTGLAKRLLSLALTAVTLWGLLPGLTATAEAAEWMEPYLEELVEWGVMRGTASGGLDPDRILTRAEFVTMINRAFGYTERGTTPFRDVPANAWYADDINIAYQAGYFTGTSETTASPLGRVTREQAAVLLGRNLRLQGIPGVNSDFKDIQQIGNWSRGMIQECVELGIIQGYADGTFRPKNYITRGQMACFLVRALGTLVHEPGDRIVGGVYGNLTVNTSGVKLRDTVITGNLYLSGGVGLGSVELENVTVMGKIVVCGAGEAQKGQSSIILRNVTAESMEIDSLSDHFMTVRTEGLTNIANTTVRTSAYLEDVTDDDQGLRLITLDGTSDGTRLQLAGNIKEVVNITPNSDLQVVQGVTDKLTMDERATGSALSIANDTSVRILNLDVATPVTGNGDVSKMNVNAAGSTASMLPDTVFVRPGITANIHNQVMDTVAAEESSDEPRLLAGYPLVRNLASTSADGVFSTNKRGTLYWAVSALLDGSLGEEELRSPSAYPGKVLRSGTINVTASKTEMTVRLTGLSREGSYYLAAMLVDERGHTSPVKVTAFTTTDDSAPSFATGYPEAVLYVDEDDEQIIQARVMANKTCRLYYALLPQNASAPTANDMRSGAIPGNLGYGTMEVRKNTAYTIPRINSGYLQEKTTYALYLWLNDADNGKSSSVQRLLVTTKDITPPVIERLEQIDPMAGNAVTMSVFLNEPGTLHWAIVKKGTPFFATDIEEVGTPPSQANNELAKMQIKRHLGVKGGSTNVARASTETRFTITGLTPQTAYDLYYVAEDRDGNFNIYTTALTPPMQVNTLDNQGPNVVAQRFSHDGSDGNTQHPTPYADTSISLVFSEEIQGIGPNSGDEKDPSNFLELYNTEQTDRLAQALAKHMPLYYKPGGTGSAIQLTADDREYGYIDYKKAEVTMDRETGEMIVTFPQDKGGLKLASGATYYFVLEGIYDTVKPTPNRMPNTDQGRLKLPEFTTLFATVNLELLGWQNLNIDGETVFADNSFRLTPVGTESVSEGTLWDMLLWTDSTMSYTLYCRERSRTEDGVWGEWGEWGLAGTAANSNVSMSISASSGANSRNSKRYASLNGYIKSDSSLNNQELPRLQDLIHEFEYAISVTDSTHVNPNARSINMEITVVAGGSYAIQTVAGGGNRGDEDRLKSAEKAGAVQIHVDNPFEVPIDIRGRAPVFESSRPSIAPGDIAATVTVQLDLPARVYYLAVPITNPDEMEKRTITMPSGETRKVLHGAGAVARLTPRKLGSDGQEVDVDLKNIYVDGSTPPEVLSFPIADDITSVSYYGEGISQGISDDELNGPVPAHASQPITIPNLKAETYYLLYLVAENYNTEDKSPVMCYQFYTKTAELPIITVTRNDSLNATIAVNRRAVLTYVVIPSTTLTDSTGGGSPFNRPFTSAEGTALSTWDSVSSSTRFSGVSTVLDAMLTSVNGVSDPSVFDVYATEDTKLYYGTLIRGMNTAGSSESNSDPVLVVSNDPFESASADGWYRKDIIMPSNKMTTDYTLLVVGHSKDSDEKNDAFRASQYYYNVDESYLKVNSARPIPPNSGTSETFTGTLYIQFSADLFYEFSQGRRYPLDDCGLPKTGDITHSTTNAVSSTISSGSFINVGSIMQIVAGSGSLELDAKRKGHERYTDVLYFNATNVPDGSTIILPSGLCGRNGNVRKGQDLVFTLTRKTAKEATPDVEGQPAVTMPDVNNPGGVIVISPAIPAQKGTPAEYSWTLEFDRVWQTGP